MSIYGIKHRVYQQDELHKGYRGGKYYLIPSEISETGESYWISRRSFPYKLIQLGIEFQEFYDVFWLNISDPKDRPKCKWCGGYIDFYGRGTISTAYQRTANLQLGEISEFCCQSCHWSYYHQHRDDYEGGRRVNEFFKNGGVLTLMRNNPDKYPNYNPGFQYSEHGTFTGVKVKESYYMSSWELRYLKYLESNPEVITYETQSLRIKYEYDGGTHIYIPDFKVTYQGRVEVVEIKPERFLDNDKVLAKAFAAMDYCQSKGWYFRFVTEFNLDDLGI